MIWCLTNVLCWQTSDTRGEALIRPSSKGSDHLSLTWMWVEGEFMHTDIKVRGNWFDDTQMCGGWLVSFHIGHLVSPARHRHLTLGRSGPLLNLVTAVGHVVARVSSQPTTLELLSFLRPHHLNQPDATPSPKSSTWPAISLLSAAVIRRCCCRRCCRFVIVVVVVFVEPGTREAAREHARASPQDWWRGVRRSG